MYTSTTNENYPSCVSLLSDRSHTIEQVLRSTLPMPSVSTTLAFLLPSSLQTLDNDLCRGPGLCILCTILPCAPLAEVPYPVSNSAFLDIDFVAARGSIGIPISGLI